MDFKHIVERIEHSEDYKDFIKNNPEYYLVHVFSVIDSEHDDMWQIGYYSKETDKIIVFEYDLETIKVHPPAEALKKDEYIQPLDIDILAVTKSDADITCKGLIKEHYPRELPSKSIMLLQNLPEFGQVWNVTMVTLTFSIINAKIDAITGNVLKHHKENLMNWRGNPK
jgi:hypothetical protein